MSRCWRMALAASVALAIGAVGAASALAGEAPEFGRCVKKPAATGTGFADRSCLHSAGSGAKYEWVAGPGAKNGFTAVERFAFSRQHRQCSLGLSEERLAKEARAEAERASEPEKAELERLALEHEKDAGEHYEAAKMTSKQCEALLRTEQAKVPARIQTVSGAEVICGGFSGSGDYSGPKSLSDVVYRLVECEMTSVPFECTSSGAGEGEIVTSELSGTLGVIRRPEVGIKARDGIDFAPEAGPFAEFQCGPDSFQLTGSVIREVKIDKSLASEKFHFRESKGMQVPEAFEDLPADVLGASLNGGASEQAGLTLRGVQTSEEAVEVNSLS